ncbi:MAG: hypothetical protein HY308_12005 [Gammaproteobacteria bacterium]|nr:hypothetical protein [Gammaproteobacteria bacterium]
MVLMVGHLIINTPNISNKADWEMEDWKFIIVGLEYLLQFQKQPMEYVDIMCDAIIQKRGMSFSVPETLAALSDVKKADVDIATLLPQPHSEATLREFFAALEAKLIETNSSSLLPPL